jgi:hypothetical protein
MFHAGQLIGRIVGDGEAHGRGEQVLVDGLVEDAGDIAGR